MIHDGQGVRKAPAMEYFLLNLLLKQFTRMDHGKPGPQEGIDVLEDCVAMGAVDQDLFGSGRLDLLDLFPRLGLK